MTRLSHIVHGERLVKWNNLELKRVLSASSWMIYGLSNRGSSFHMLPLQDAFGSDLLLYKYKLIDFHLVSLKKKKNSPLVVFQKLWIAWQINTCNGRVKPTALFRPWYNTASSLTFWSDVTKNICHWPVLLIKTFGWFFWSEAGLGDVLSLDVFRQSNKNSHETLLRKYVCLIYRVWKV